MAGEVWTLESDLVESVFVVIERVARPLTYDKAVVGSIKGLTDSQFVAEVGTVQAVAKQGAMFQAVDDPTGVCRVVYGFKIE